MTRKNARILWKYVGYWFMFNSLLVLSTLVNPNQIDKIYYINCSIYSALSFLAFRIRRSEQFNKDIFLNIALLFGIMAVVELISFWNNSYFSLSHVYQSILFASFGLFTISFIVSKYLASHLKSCIHYLIASATTIGFCLVNFCQYLARDGINNTCSAELIRIYIFIGILIFVYALKVYKQDSPTGEYLHLLVIGFFFWFLRYGIDNFSNAYNLIIFQENKYLELLNLGFLLIILLKKLNYSTSDFGKFYEQMIYGQLKLGEIKIQRRGKNRLKFLVELGYNFFQTPKSLPILFVLIGSQGFFTISFYHALNFTVNFMFILIIFLFTAQVYRKRINQNYILDY